MIFAFSAISWSCLWCVQNLFAISLSKLQLNNSVIPPDLCRKLFIRDLPRDACWEEDILIT